MDTVRWGIIGAGNIAQRFAQSLSHEPHSELVAVSGRTHKNLEAFVGKFPAQICASHQELIERPDIDAVYIALPHGLHAEWSIKALEAGKAVLCEKPAALTAAQMAAVASVAMDRGVLFMEAMKPRFTPIYQPILDKVAESAIGEVGSVEASLLRTFPKDRLGYFTEPGQGGVAWDMGIYGASWICQFASGAIDVVHHEQETADMVDWYDDCSMNVGDTACRLTCAGDRGDSCTAVIRGSLGTIEVDDLHRPQHARIRYNDGTDEELDVPYNVDDFYGQIEHFVGLMLAGKTESPVMGLADSIACARVIDIVRSGYDRYAVADALKLIVGDNNVLFDEPMSEHTTFKVGGPCDLYVVPESRSRLIDCLRAVREAKAPFFVLGKGSDLLVSDDGFRGVVIAVGDGLSDVTTDGTSITCQAGVPIIEASEMAAALGLTGLEFACGIPGSVGGAVFMNAGAYDGCCADVLKEAEVIFPDGHLETLANKDLNLAYRTSRVRTDGLVVVSATFDLEPGDADKIRAKMDDFTERRESKQPLELPSAGSTFKRPEGYFVGKLVTDAGLRGYQYGGAAVSKKHAGFVVNLDHGTAADVIGVIHHVQDVIYKENGVKLEPEVRFLGWF